MPFCLTAIVLKPNMQTDHLAGIVTAVANRRRVISPDVTRLTLVVRHVGAALLVTAAIIAVMPAATTEDRVFAVYAVAGPPAGRAIRAAQRLDVAYLRSWMPIGCWRH